jgi:hypothetical protein
VSAVSVAASAALVGVSAPRASAVRAELGPPPGAPSLALMALGTADLPTGASVRYQGYVRDANFVAYYVRTFAPGVSLGRSRLTSLESDVGLASEPARAARLTSAALSTLRTAKGRRGLVMSTLDAAGWPGEGAHITSWGARALAAGDAAFVSTIDVSIPGRRRFTVMLELVRVERALQLLTLLGSPNTRVVPAEATRLAVAAAGHMRAGLVPGLSVAPIVTGVAQEGQTLAAGTGGWANAPTAFATQWLRCSATGTACMPIGGETGPTYLVVAADVGSTIAISVMATNGAGSSLPAVSASTAVVVPAAPASGSS